MMPCLSDNAIGGVCCLCSRCGLSLKKQQPCKEQSQLPALGVETAHHFSSLVSRFCVLCSARARHLSAPPQSPLSQVTRTATLLQHVQMGLEQSRENRYTGEEDRTSPRCSFGTVHRELQHPGIHIMSLRSRSHSQSQLQAMPYSQTSQTKGRTASNPWIQYSDFFSNSSFLIPDTISFAKILPYFKALPNYSSRFNIKLVELVGYEAYFVEQWISSRSSNNLIVTYTGDQNDRLIAYHVQALSHNLQLQPPPQIHEPSKSLSNTQHSASSSLPYDNWPPKFISYLVEQLESPFCVATETSLGYAFITNLTQLNPFLSLIDAKTGNIVEDYNNYVVNYNLRKLGCGSRSATTIDEPTKSMEDKFKSTFKIDSKVPINYAAVDLILITQTFLYIYGLLDPLYCDGLFCEKTETAIREWWKLISDIPMASHVIRLKPPTSHTSDSIQAIIGFTVLCRYLLELGGNNFGVPKDPMDIRKYKEAISKFQRHSKITATSKLNLETIFKLMEWGQNNKVSQNLTKDLSKMKKLVKNTVIDITSGKNLQIIAHNATASPFYLHSHATYDQSKLINCQNIDHIKHMSLGKQLSYLHFANGKPIDLGKDSLAVIINNKIAESTSNNSIIHGVKRLKSQLSMQSFQSPKKNSSSSVLNFFDKDSDHRDIEQVLVNDDDFAVPENDTENGNTEKRKSKRSPSSIYLSSEDEQNGSGNNNNRTTSLADFDYDYYNNDVAIYNPNKTKMNNNNQPQNHQNPNKSNSLGAFSCTSDDHYADYDGDYTVEYHGNSNSLNSSSAKVQHKNLIDMNHIDEALIDDELSDTDYYHGFNINNNKSRRNTDNTKFNGKDMKSFYSPPHLIGAGEFSGSNSRGNSVKMSHQLKQPHAAKVSHIEGDYDSDGVYEYENGFEYDYELDSNHHQNPNHNTQNRDSIRRHLNRTSSKDHSRRPSSLMLSNVTSVGGNDFQGGIGQVNTAFSTQTNLTSAQSHNNHPVVTSDDDNIDHDYVNFMRRIKRRHSIPLVEFELNKYSIEMKLKRERIENTVNANLERKHSWGGSGRKSLWDRASLNSTTTEEEMNSKANIDLGNDLNDVNSNKDENDIDANGNGFLYRMKRRQSIFGSQSINTSNSGKSAGYVSLDKYIIYHKPTNSENLRRSQSFSVIEKSMICGGKGAAIYGFEFSDVTFLTSEVLAMRYLKLEADYQVKIVQGSFNLAQDSQNYSRLLFDSINCETNPNTCILLFYNTTRNDIKKVVGKYFELEDKLKNTVKSNARLKYELRLLLQKTKEVENNLITLQDFKIRTLDAKINSLMSKLTNNNGVKLDAELNSFLDNENNDKNGNKFKSRNIDFNADVDENDEDTSISIVDRLYADDGKISWEKLSFKAIWNNPYILIYLLFHFIVCVILRRVDTKMVQERWKRIDKNQTVTMIIRKLYSKSEREAHKEKEREMEEEMLKGLENKKGK